jgi:alpha-amylase
LGRADGLAYVYTDLGRAGGLDSDRFLDAYADPALASMMRFRQAVAGQPQDLVWESDQVIAWRRGRNGLVVINKSGTEEFDLARLGLSGLADGSYKDVLSGLTLNLRSGRLRADDVNIPTRAAALFLRD